MVKNCDLGLEDAALVLRPRAVFSPFVNVVRISNDEITCGKRKRNMNSV